MSLHETAGSEFVPAKRKNLPNRILRAFDNAKHLGGLQRGVKDTLAELCRFMPQNRPFDTIFAHKATIAARVGASERTIYRHLATLQQHQLIEVLEQDRKSRNGRFSVARIRLTHMAAVLLGLIDPPDELAPSPALAQTDAESAPMQADDAAHIETVEVAISPASQPTATECSDLGAPSKRVIPSAPSDKMASGHTLSVPTFSKNQPPQRTENGLPIDLAWMTGNGLSRAGVFKLMGKAKSHGKRLSDIVTVVREYIRDLKGGKLYAYLAKLAGGPTDFAVAAAVERQRQHEAEKARALARKAEVFRTRFRNTCLTNRSQTRLYVIDEHARFAQIYGDEYPTTVPLTDLAEWIERLESGRLVLATLAVERRLLG
jgi:DNA-binding transcriptional ArsR family regulator